MLRVLDVPVCTAAPASTIRSVTWRPCSGSSRICSLLTTELMPALRTSTSGAAASTVTDCSSAPTLSTALTVGVDGTVMRDTQTGADDGGRADTGVRQ